MCVVLTIVCFWPDIVDTWTTAAMIRKAVFIGFSNTYNKPRNYDQWHNVLQSIRRQ